MYVLAHCVATVSFHNTIRGKEIKVWVWRQLKANNRVHNGTVLKASLSAFFCSRVCSNTGELRLADWHVLACLNRTSKNTGPWRIESWGHELHSYPHKAEPRVSAPLKTDKECGVETLWNAKGPGNQMPIDFNTSWVRNDFLQHNRWRVEKWVLKAVLWEIKGSWCTCIHYTHTEFNGWSLTHVLRERLGQRKIKADNSYHCYFYYTCMLTCYFIQTSSIQLKLFYNHRPALSFW